MTNCFDRDQNTASPSVRESLYQLTAHLNQPIHTGLQYLITWLTAKPYSGQRPLLKLTPATYLILALMQIALGSLITWFLVSQSVSSWLYLLLYYSYSLTVGGFRILEGTINHQAVHDNLFQDSAMQQILAEILSTVMMTEPFDGYVTNHVKRHHNRKIFATSKDPAYQPVLTEGFFPGRTLLEYWLQLGKRLLNPVSYISQLKNRIAVNLTAEKSYRRVMAGIWLIMLALAIYQHPMLLLIWGPPLTIYHRISALLSSLTEHRWGDFDPTVSSKVNYCRKTFGRFSGEPVPNTTPIQSPLKWLFWLSRWLLLHLPIRLGVWVGEMPEHDYHHRYGHSPNWLSGSYARQGDLDAGCPGWPEPYTECWGIVAALNEVFESLSQSQPLASDCQQLTKVAQTED
jgi:hypothetical protein